MLGLPVACAAPAFPSQNLVNFPMYFYHAIVSSSVYVLYVVQCGTHLLTVLLISCRLQLTVWFNSANVMFNSSGCNFVLSTM